ncbi:hypothetical protein [Roseibium sp.]|uniref:hypothetical protein n=1 Tax=Roseibium sp. TaxID=1936156 RepID=UPI003A978F89
MHTEFWAEMPGANFKNDEDRAAHLRRLERATLGYLTFEQEVWNSRKASQEAGKVVQSPGYEAAKAEALAALDGVRTQKAWEADIKSEDPTWTLNLSMEGYGIALPTYQVVESEWRGRMTASGQGETKATSMATGEETGEVLTVSTRTVVLEEQNAILLISVATQGTADPGAGQIRERLEEKLQILQ